MINAIKFFLIVYFFICHYAFATPISSQDKLDFQRSSVPSCIAKQNSSRSLSASEKDGVVLYCNCHASVMASLVTKEEMIEISKGKLPSTFEPKIVEARKQCIKSLTN